jgi:hypothetical protein
MGLSRGFDIWVHGSIPTLEQVRLDFYYMSKDKVKQLKEVLAESVGRGLLWKIQFNAMNIIALLKSFTITLGSDIGWAGTGSNSHALNVSVNMSFTIVKW